MNYDYRFGQNISTGSKNAIFELFPCNLYCSWPKIKNEQEVSNF
jgi:hypothetical protein